MPEYVQDSVEDMRYILNLMSDVRFACLQGSCTKEEAFEMITWRQLKQHVKPIILINTNNYWKPFCALVENVEHRGFAHGDPIQYFKVAPDPLSAIGILTPTSG